MTPKTAQIIVLATAKTKPGKEVELERALRDIPAKDSIMTDSHGTAAFDFRKASQQRARIGMFLSGGWPRDSCS
jgi:hypothetical protein